MVYQCNTNIKCSGICIATGVDSTYWHKIINRLLAQSFATLPRLLDMDATTEKDSISAILTKIYNKNLLFAPG